MQIFYDSIVSQFPKELTTPENTITYHNALCGGPLLVTPKFCISVVFCFSWEFKWHQEKLKSMLMQNFGVTNEEYYGMLWFFLEWSIKKNDQKASTGCAWLESIRDMSIA